MMMMCRIQITIIIPPLAGALLLTPRRLSVGETEAELQRLGELDVRLALERAVRLVADRSHVHLPSSEWSERTQILETPLEFS